MAVHLPEIPYRAEQLVNLARAIEILERELPEYDVRFDRVEGRPDRGQQPQPPILRAPSLLNASLTQRQRVLGMTTDRYSSVPEIMEATGLTEDQVRGVVNAPDMVFERNREGGVVKYRHTGTRERQR